MKKRAAMLLCTSLALLSMTALPALAAEQHYPISVEEYMKDGNSRIQKVYQLSLSDDPSGIPTGEFERDGRLYYLLDITRRDEIGVDTQDYTETITLDSDTGDMAEVLQRLDGQMEAATEDGYTGTLILDHTSVKVEVKGYRTSTRNLSATRTYPSLSDADLSLVPKTIADSGHTLTLADVQWANDGTFYTATAVYTGTSSSRYATGYTVTADYTGQVSKTNCDVVTYTAVFGSMELPTQAEELPLEAEELPGQESQTEPEAPDADAGSIQMSWLPVLGCAGGAAVLAAAAFWCVQKVKDRRAQK